MTGEHLAAGVDRRVGTNSGTHVGSAWADVEAAFEFWIGRLMRSLQGYGMRPTKTNG